MGTRATYRIKEIREDGFEPIAYYYIHWDGYPSGVVKYIERAKMAFDKRESERPGSFILAFGVGNQPAELTVDHEEHCDTDYQYNIFYNFTTGLITIKMEGIDNFIGTFNQFKDKFGGQDASR